MIIFDKFGDGQSERNRSVPAFPNNSMRTVTRVSPLRPLALTKEETKERHPSGMTERLSRSALVPISESPSRAPISDANFRQLTTFLPGSGRKVEVTEKKRLNPVYPGLELHVTVAQFHAEFHTESQAQRESECRSRDAAEQSKLPLHTRIEKELS